ncbi:MAG TPA: hypothetical protein VIE16_07710 [Phenylobacterium sp.]|jgi:hypothetical protein
MRTFMMERPIPPRFDVSQPDQVALHARWAVDAYREVGAFWLGGVITEDRMFSLVVAEEEADLQRYCRSLGIDEQEVTLHRVVRPLGPFLAMARTDERFRAPLR